MEITEEVLYELIYKLNGSIISIGSSQIDNERFKNLKVLGNTIYNLVSDLCDESNKKIVVCIALVKTDWKHTNKLNIYICILKNI